ncbi:MAG: hypothetical protein RLO50_19710 [Azospirillaceae bacterium]
MAPSLPVTVRGPRSWPAAALLVAALLAASLGLVTMPAAAQVDSEIPAADEVVEIDGFRSVTFGMTEAQVLGAIEADYGIQAEAVERILNPLDRTVTLSILVEDLLPAGGAAHLAFGFSRSARLLHQIVITWGALADPETPLQDLLRTDAILRNYFVQRRFAENTVLGDLPLSDGSYLSFTGSDEQGRRASLVIGALTERFVPFDPNAVAGLPVFVRLSYLESPGEQDVFRLQPPF